MPRDHRIEFVFAVSQRFVALVPFKLRASIADEAHAVGDLAVFDEAGETTVGR